MLDFSYIYPAVSHDAPFYLSASGILWTATPSNKTNTRAFIVELGDGQVVTDAVTAKHAVLCVKSKPITGAVTPRFRTTKNGSIDEVLDLFTGLTWTKTTETSSQTGANTICQSIKQSVFIAPSVKEAHSLFDTSHDYPWVKSTYFPGLIETWSSSGAPDQGKGWLVSYSIGAQPDWSTTTHQLICHE